jgi:hypothetical protein
LAFSQSSGFAGGGWYLYCNTGTVGGYGYSPGLGVGPVQHLYPTACYYVFTGGGGGGYSGSGGTGGSGSGGSGVAAPPVGVWDGIFDDENFDVDVAMTCDYVDIERGREARRQAILNNGTDANAAGNTYTATLIGGFIEVWGNTGVGSPARLISSDCYGGGNGGGGGGGYTP